jgi:segregation and condensation protein B
MTVMNKENLRNIVEALIFSSEKPLNLKQIKDVILESKDSTGVSVKLEQIEEAIGQLIEKYKSSEYSFSLVRIAGGFRFATKKDFAVWLSKLSKEKRKRRLSQSALETLAIIAYNNPITRSEIEAIRGVPVDYILGSLLEKELIRITGRANTLGRPMLYAVTDTFLEYLGINSVADLPPLKAIDEIIKSAPPEGITQSDIDFFEEINQMKQQVQSEVSTDDATPEINEIGSEDNENSLHGITAETVSGENPDDDEESSDFIETET